MYVWCGYAFVNGGAVIAVTDVVVFRVVYSVCIRCVCIVAVVVVVGGSVDVISWFVICVDVDVVCVGGVGVGDSDGV